MMFWMAAAFGLFGVLTVSAQEPSLPSVPTQIKWERGPYLASLGAVAEINVPEGYKFTDAQGARVTLEGLHLPVPEGLLGVVTPRSGEWALALSYNSVGHIQETDGAKLDADTLLKAAWDHASSENRERAAKGSSPVTHVNWVMAPAYDAKNHILQSALRQEGQSERDQRVTYSARVLGRRGYMDATMVLVTASDLSPMKELVRNIRFVNGERFTDFTPKDKQAAGGLTALMNGTLRSGMADASTSSAGGVGVTGFWIALGSIALVGIVGATFLVRRVRMQKSQKPAAVSSAAVAPAFSTSAAPVAAVVQPASAPAVSVAVKPAANGAKSLKLSFRPAPVRTNGKATNGHPPANGKKRRMFNYEKFYTEMMLQGPAPSISDGYVGQNGNGHNGHNGYNGQNGNDSEYARQNGNGHSNGNGYSNGNGNGHSNGSLNAHSDIINGQKSLIEDQKRLIQEQARLIEEKSKLIAEKNQLLDRQSQFLDKHLL
jgi:uncharacterized membrane-anchored protein